VPAATPSATRGATVIGQDPVSDPGSGLAAIRPGTYQLASFSPAFQFKIDPGWTDRSWHTIFSTGDRALLALGKAGWDCCGYPLADRPAAGIMPVEILRLQTVLGNPCDGGDLSNYQALEGRPKDVTDWLQSHRFLNATNLRPIAAGDWRGLSIDVTVKGDPGIECAGLKVPHQGSVYLLRTEDSEQVQVGTIFRLRDGDQARFIILDTGEQVPLVLLGWSRAADFQLRAPWLDELAATITHETE